MSIIRPAKIKDLPEIVKMRVELSRYHEALGDYLKVSKNAGKFYYDFYKSFIYSKKKILLVAEIGDELIGFGSAYITAKDPIYNIVKYGHIRDMFIKAKFRRRGAAGEILKVFYEWFRKNKIKYIELNVMRDNKLGRRAWAKYGFKDYLIRKRKILK